MNTEKLETAVEKLFKMEVISEGTDTSAIHDVIQKLDLGELRVCNYEAASDKWIVNDWIKKAILTFFKIQKIVPMGTGEFEFFDKIPVKKWNESMKVRVVPQAIARYGSFLAPGTILMPSYVNIGAYVDSGTMVDTWATVGSCAQVGKNVHLSGGVGIGGVLEPVQAQPVIIEDNVFIGSRVVVVEGVRIRKGAVIGTGVVLSSSTKIIDVTGESPVVYKGEVPENAVVVPGGVSKKFPAGDFSMNCALIIGKRSEKTDKKTSLNSVLRDFEM